MQCVHFVSLCRYKFLQTSLYFYSILLQNLYSSSFMIFSFVPQSCISLQVKILQTSLYFDSVLCATDLCGLLFTIFLTVHSMSAWSRAIVTQYSYTACLQITCVTGSVSVKTLTKQQWKNGQPFGDCNSFADAKCC